MPFVKHIDPQAHELTRAMLGALSSATWRPPLKSAGWNPNLIGFAPPDADRSRPREFYVGELDQMPLFPAPTGTRLQCRHFFPEGGGMDWHTDSGQPGLRLYVYVYRFGNGVFRYADDVTYFEDRSGAYVFETGPHCWHAIRSDGGRLSCGLTIPLSLAESLVAA